MLEDPCGDWELDWLTDEVRRPADYIYTEKEWAVLERLQRCAVPFSGYVGYTAQELIAIAYRGRFDLDESDQEFIERLHARGPAQLKRRQIRSLAAICRNFDDVGYDPLLDHTVEPDSIATQVALTA